MTDKKILKKAIDKALKNGMFAKTIDKGTFYQIYVLFTTREGVRLKRAEFVPEDCYGIIFDHDFARAFWGDYGELHEKFVETHTEILWDSYEEINFGGGHWQYHLSQMVLEENPYQYLKNYL